MFKIFVERVLIIEPRSGAFGATAAAPRWNPTILLAADATIDVPSGDPPEMKFIAPATDAGLSATPTPGLIAGLIATICCLLCL